MHFLLFFINQPNSQSMKFQCVVFALFKVLCQMMCLWLPWLPKVPCWYCNHVSLLLHKDWLYYMQIQHWMITKLSCTMVMLWSSYSIKRLEPKYWRHFIGNWHRLFSKLYAINTNMHIYMLYSFMEFVIVGLLQDILLGNKWLQLCYMGAMYSLTLLT